MNQSECQFRSSTCRHLGDQHLLDMLYPPVELRYLTYGRENPWFPATFNFNGDMFVFQRVCVFFNVDMSGASEQSMFLKHGDILHINCLYVRFLPTVAACFLKMAQVSVSFGAAFFVWLGVQAHLGLRWRHVVEITLEAPKTFPLKNQHGTLKMAGPLRKRRSFFFFLKPSDVRFREFFAVLFNADTVDSSEIQLTVIFSMVRALEHHTKQGSPDF